MLRELIEFISHYLNESDILALKLSSKINVGWRDYFMFNDNIVRCCKNNHEISLKIHLMTLGYCDDWRNGFYEACKNGNDKIVDLILEKMVGIMMMVDGEFTLDQGLIFGGKHYSIANLLINKWGIECYWNIILEGIGCYNTDYNTDYKIIDLIISKGLSSTNDDPLKRLKLDDTCNCCGLLISDHLEPKDK